MKLKNILPAIIGGLVVAVVLLLLGPTQNNSQQDKQSAFDRIVETGTIRCGYAVWPPYLLKDPKTGKIGGINYDVMEAIAKILDVKLEWAEETDWTAAIEGLETERYDVFCATLWPDGPRSKNATLTIPTFYSAVYAYVRADDTRFDGDLSKINSPDVTIAGLEGDVTHDLAGTEFPEAKVWGLSQLNTGSDLLESVATKKADVTFVDEGIAKIYNQNNDNKLRQVANVGPVRVFGEVHAVKKGEFALKNMLDTTITTLINSGKIERFINNYESSYYPAREGYKK